MGDKAAAASTRKEYQEKKESDDIHVQQQANTSIRYPLHCYSAFTIASAEDVLLSKMQ